MNDSARQLAVRRASVPIRRKTAGRPSKVEDVVNCINEIYPDGIRDLAMKAVHRRVEEVLPFSVGTTTVATAIKRVKSGQ